MSSAVAEIQQDLQKERRSRGGGAGGGDFDEAEVRIRGAGGVGTNSRRFRGKRSLSGVQRTQPHAISRGYLKLVVIVQVLFLL